MWLKIFRAPPDMMGGEDAGFGESSGELFVQATPNEVSLPEGFNPATASFVRAGPDLMLTSPDGTEVLIADFFMMETPPALVGVDGARVMGELVAHLAGSATPGQVAGEIPDLGQVIGRVTDLNGQVTVVRADGSRMTLQVGDTLYQGDILDTERESAVGALLADGTSISMGEDARLVLDEMVYDPGTQEGSIAVSVMKGIFTIVSGEISKTSPDAMVIQTPVATIGIRGTQIGLDLSDGQNLTLVMMEEADGFVGEVAVVNFGGVMTLNEAYNAITVNAFTAAPAAAPAYTPENVIATFGSALTYLPAEDNNANDYGQQAALVEDAAAFETAAGGTEPPVEEAQTDETDLATLEEQPLEDAMAAQTPTPEADLPQDLAGMDTQAEILPQPIEGLAGFDTTLPDGAEPEGEFITSAGPDLSAEDLLAESEVVFGDEAKPIEPIGSLETEVPDETVATFENADAGAGGETVPEALPEAAPEPENTAPLAEAGTAVLAEDNVFTGQLSASDLEGGVLEFSLADDGGPAHGTVIVHADGTFTYTPDPDYGGTDNFTYMVTDDAGAIAMATVSVTVTPVSDVPNLAAADVNGFEDSAIALTLAVTMPSTTSETVERIVISGVPDGARLSAGTDNGTGSWDLSTDQLNGLTLTPPKDYSGSFTLDATAVSSDGGAASTSFGLHVGPVADVPQLAVADVNAAEDSAVMLAIATAMPTSTGETVDSILLTGVPQGAFLNGGADNGDGTWSLTPADLGGLTLTPPVDYNGVFDIGVSVTASDGGVATDGFTVSINPVSDTPQIATTDVTGSEDGAIALTLAAGMSAGTSETVDTIIIAGVPAGASLSAGTDNGDGTWSLSPDQLSLLSLTPPPDYNGRFELSVTAESSDGGTANGSFVVTVLPAADVPQLAVADASGAEDTAIALTLAASMAVGSTEAVHTITIEDLPAGASLSAGIDNGDGSWTLTPDLLDGLAITPPQDYSGTFDLVIHATSTDGGVATETIDVSVAPMADVPVVAVTDANGAEDTAIVLSIAAGMPGGTAETVDSVIVTGVPDGAALSTGTDNGDGSWTLTAGDLDGLSITPPADYNGVFNLGVHVTSTDGGVASSALTVHVGAVSDIPVIAVSDVTGAEDSAIALNIAAGMPVGTHETLDTIILSGVPDGTILSAGTDNGDGTWDLMAVDLAGLTLTPPVNYSGAMALSVTAVSSDGGTATSTFNTALTPIADVPVLQVSDVVVTLSDIGDGIEIEGTRRSDELYGTQGDDEIDGGAGHDLIYGDSDMLPPSSDDEATGTPMVVVLDVDAALADIDGSEALSITIANVPPGANLSAGADNRDGTWTLLGHDLEQLDSLTMTLPASAPLETFTLTVSAVATEVAGGDSAARSAQIDVSFDFPGGDDEIDGGSGNDEIHGGGGDDVIDGGSGHDLAFGDAGDDKIDGGSGHDALLGGEGDDVLDGGKHNDILVGGAGDDTLEGGSGRDILAGGGGQDRLDGGSGNDVLAAGMGDDALDGGKGNDRLYGQAGDDTLEGGKGRDRLDGGAGDDTLDGGKSNDVLIGGAGDDTLEGGSGRDQFVFHAGDGDDIVLDLSHQDVLRFEGQEFKMEDFILNADPESESTTITFGADAGVSVTLNDVHAEPGEGYTVSQDGDAVVVTFDRDSIG